MYTLDEIKHRVKPIAKKHGLRGVYLFGSYARSEATDESDIDFVIDTAGIKNLSMFSIGGIFVDLENAFSEMNVDILTLNQITNPINRTSAKQLAHEVQKEMVRIA